MTDPAISSSPAIDPPKADAIHRALLTGLIGNVGLRNPDSHEYTGARNTKFSIFPGSALFKKRPQWIMSAELVETTRLYARTNAPIRPEWIERAAQHLVHRTYFEPHWQRQTAHVVAYEKVTLSGLVLVARRLVHYGPIDPEVSRRIFIERALVDGDFRTNAGWFKHNRALIKTVEAMEAKTRRRDLLADEVAQFAFYDARVPADIYNGPLFDTWRSHIERGRPTLLFMHLRDLLKRPADDITPGKYPDELRVGDMLLPLTYLFDAAHPIDGITVTVPLAGLNQLRAEQFEWLVPGWVEEKILALIRSLPKPLRTQFIPAPDFAANAAATLKAGDGSLHEALAIFLGKSSGTAIHATSFDLSTIPPHLFMHFRVIDESGQTIAQGQDLNQIKSELGMRVQADLKKLTQNPWNRENVTSWDFGDLPERIEIQRHGMTLHTYPALVDNGKTASLRLFESPHAASIANRAGVRRLFIVQLGSDAKHLARHVQNLDEASLLYSSLGPAEELRDDILIAAAEEALYSTGGEIRTREAFVQHAQSGWRTLLAAANHISEIALAALRELSEIHKLMALPMAPQWRDAFTDIRRQLADLMPRNFVARTPSTWLPHLPRYVKAIRIRLEKLRDQGYSRDLAGLVQIDPMFQLYRERRAAHERSSIVDPELEKYRWMLEEFRVSLFAQEMKTSIPVSIQRLDRQWALVRD